MAKFWRKKRPGTLREADDSDTKHLVDFARTRSGVEAFVEPKTTVTDTTIVLVAADGEWTRRRTPGADAAEKMARKLGIPIYDAGVMGYPERMREWTRLQKEQGRQTR